MLFFELLFLLNKDFQLELQVSTETVPAVVWNRNEGHGGRRNRVSVLRQHEFIWKHILHRLWRTRNQEGGLELELEKLDFVDSPIHWG